MTAVWDSENGKRQQAVQTGYLRTIRRSINVIEISNLVKKYGDHIAVDHLSLTVAPENS